MADADTEHPTILLAHNPDVILDEESTAANLVIAAHTHGGQIRLPFLGSLAPIPTKLGRAFDRGWFSLQEGRALFITTGVGESGVRARLFVPPQIDVLTVHW
jgi:predicted MPP superfamily phosphohydrolase